MMLFQLMTRDLTTNIRIAILTAMVFAALC